MIGLKTILHPTDFSEHSRYALELACALARDQAARVLLLHVVPHPAQVTDADVPALKSQHTEEDLKAYREEMARLLAKVRGNAPCTQVETLLKEGNVADVISRTAEETPCDLIVMGTHGRSRMYQLMMGSVAADVTRNAPCPVVTVKAPLLQP
jgi:nucleotide-binding universal stress UspA family protein